MKFRKQEVTTTVPEGFQELLCPLCGEVIGYSREEGSPKHAFGKMVILNKEATEKFRDPAVERAMEALAEIHAEEIGNQWAAEALFKMIREHKCKAEEKQ